VKRRLFASGFVLVAAVVTHGTALSASAWTLTDIGVSLTMPGESSVVKTRLEVGADGDGRVTIDISDGKQRTAGTILLVSGRWMLTQGLKLEPGAEIDYLDLAALNAQLVMALLNAALPTGPPAPGSSRTVSVAEKARPIQVNTSSASAEYGTPWSVVGTVSVPSPGAAAHYQLKFSYTDESGTVVEDLTGTAGNAATAVKLGDSMKLDGCSQARPL
jgi:hypothetical protein